uniref:Uncharacterized protein n=1 Tax=Anopheles melas TaxID=34690 RepID=A0A182TH00_9DIPT
MSSLLSTSFSLARSCSIDSTVSVACSPSLSSSSYSALKSDLIALSEPSSATLSSSVKHSSSSSRILLCSHQCTEALQVLLRSAGALTPSRATTTVPEAAFDLATIGEGSSDPQVHLEAPEISDASVTHKATIVHRSNRSRREGQLRVRAVACNR